MRIGVCEGVADIVGFFQLLAWVQERDSLTVWAKVYLAKQEVQTEAKQTFLRDFGLGCFKAESIEGSVLSDLKEFLCVFMMWVAYLSQIVVSWIFF